MKRTRSPHRLLPSALILLLLLTACAAPEEVADAEPEAETPADEPEADADDPVTDETDADEAATDEADEADAEAAADLPEFITIGTGGTGGDAYPIGGGVASLLNERLGATVTAEATGGSVENVRLIDQGDSEFGQIQSDVAFEACTGAGPFSEDGPLDLTTYLVMYPNVNALITPQDSGIDSYDDLAGRRVGVGDQGSGTDLMASRILEAMGMSYDDFSVSYLSLGDQTAAMRDGQLDAAFWSGPRTGGTSSLADLASSEPINWELAPTDEQVAAVEDALPYYTADVIPEGAYTGMETDMLTFVVYHTYLGTPDLSEDAVYDIVSTILTELEELSRVHPAVEDIAPENILESQCPVHPGAARAYAEMGVDVPEDLIAG